MKNLEIYFRKTRRQIVLALPLLFLCCLSGYFPAPVAAATFTVTNTSGGGTGSLVQAVTDANLNSGSDTIDFNIPPNDPRHFYYRNDNVAGTVSQSMIAVTTAADDATITDIDPDWAHSWYSIQLAGTNDLFSTGDLTINGYTQPGASANTNASGGLNTVLRIEINGAGNLCVRNVFQPFRVHGLVFNRCGTSIGGGAGVEAVASDGNIISGNFIGTDPSGTIDLGNFSGVFIGEANGSVIGGNSPADRNLVSGNRKDGIRLQGAGSRTTNNNFVIGNLVGTMRDGISPLGNGFASSTDIENQAILLISVSQPVSNNTIANNVVAFNSWNGIDVNGAGVGTSGAGNNNRISGNSVHSNGRLGINLGALDPPNQVTPNDPCDADMGFNNLQNYPVLSSVSLSGNNLNISGTLDSNAGGTFTLEFYSSPERDPTGFGEGKTFLGSTTVTDSDNDCISNFTATVPRRVNSEAFITATATDANGNTSEFSSAITARPHLFDFDGDFRDDFALFRPSSGLWLLQRSSAGFAGPQWGLASDKLAPADYDGDGKTDIAVWRESEGNFYILNSLNNSVRVENFGLAGDLPVTVGDWDGDGKADLSVYRDGGQSLFFYRGSNNNPNGNITFLPWGTNGDKPVRGDFDGDGKTDACVFRPSNGTWFVLRSMTQTMLAVNWGLSSDRLVASDYDGDAKTDFAVFRPSDRVWYILNSSNNQPRFQQWGLSNDKLVPADYDGDGKADIAVWRDADQNFYVLQSAANQFNAFRFGLSGDAPVVSAFVP